MWINTIAKRFVKSEDPNETKIRFKCPMSCGWIYKSNDRDKNNCNFMTTLWKYIINVSTYKPSQDLLFVPYSMRNKILEDERLTADEIDELVKNKEYNHLIDVSKIYCSTGLSFPPSGVYWYKLLRRSNYDILKVSKLDKTYKHCDRSSETIMSIAMEKRNIKTIIIDKNGSMSFVPKDNQQINLSELDHKEIDELSYYNQYFQYEKIIITNDSENEFLLIEIELIPEYFISENNEFNKNNQNFKRMFLKFPELYTKMIRIYSNPKEFINSIILPLLFNKITNKIDLSVSNNNVEIKRNLEFYTKIYEEAFDKKLNLSDLLKLNNY